ncbi:hypothetical protein BaRGS_00031833 [Batillaria attramentaria]|uniref:Uncharacterized protein n=1 Tax=Batillaria attramentaria TaxID=370345 RepID=A0ABD0JQ55_9CAEN
MEDNLNHQVDRGIDACLEPILKCMSFSGFPVLQRPSAQTESAPEHDIPGDCNPRSEHSNGRRDSPQDESSHFTSDISNSNSNESGVNQSTGKNARSRLKDFRYASGTSCSMSAWWRQRVTSWVVSDTMLPGQPQESEKKRTGRPSTGIIFRPAVSRQIRQPLDVTYSATDNCVNTSQTEVVDDDTRFQRCTDVPGVEVCLEPMLKWLSVFGFPVLQRPTSSDKKPPSDLSTNPLSPQAKIGSSDLRPQPATAVQNSKRSPMTDGKERLPTRPNDSAYTLGRECSKVAWMRQTVTSWLTGILLVMGALRTPFLFRDTAAPKFRYASSLVLLVSLIGL